MEGDIMTEEVKHGLDKTERVPHYGRALEMTTVCYCGEKFTATVPADLDPSDPRAYDNAWHEAVNEAFKAIRDHEIFTWKQVTGRVVPTEDAISQIGEGVHTGLRKGSYQSDSHAIWKTIYDSKTSAWHDGVAWFVEVMKMTGYAIVKLEEDDSVEGTKL